MKRWMAMMLSGCLLLQSWMGSSIQADGAERITAEQQVAEKTVTERNVTEKAAAEKSEGALVVEVKPSLLVPFLGNVTVELLSLIHISEPTRRTQ